MKGYPACYAGGDAEKSVGGLRRRSSGETSEKDSRAWMPDAEDAWGSPEREREREFMHHFEPEQFRCGLRCACRGLTLGATQRFQQ